MLRAARQVVVQWATLLPGWVFLLSGLLALAVTLLTPAYLENRELAWQRDLVGRQADTVAAQQHDYRAFLAAYDSGDPVLLQRLAYHYLRLKPAGTYLAAQAAAQGLRPDAPYTAEAYSTVTAWLDRPLPRVGVDFPAYSPTESFLTRVTTGPLRLLVLAAGTIALLLGLMPAPKPPAPALEDENDALPAVVTADEATVAGNDLPDDSSAVLTAPLPLAPVAATTPEPSGISVAAPPVHDPTPISIAAPALASADQTPRTSIPWLSVAAPPPETPPPLPSSETPVEAVLDEPAQARPEPDVDSV